MKLRSPLPASYPAFVIAIADDLDVGTDDLWFTVTADEQIHASINCNDFFEWATSESVYIAPEDRDLLIATAQDLIELGAAHPYEDGKAGFYPELDLFSLFAARKEGRRPQGAWLYNEQYCDKRLVPLFEAVGEARKSGMWNPVASPDVTPDQPTE